MSDPKPDRILAEESDNPWVKLILWSNEHPIRPAYRWNGFMKYLVEERRARLESLNMTDERRLILMQDWGVASEQLERAWSLSVDELEHAKNLFPIDTDFSQLLPNITIDNLIFRKELSFAGAFFARPISFKNCCFERPVDFYGANFEQGPYFRALNFRKPSISETLNSAVAALFDRVTFCGQINFYWSENDI